MKNNHPTLKEEIENLPDHYHDTFSQSFLELLAALRLHNFSILRADEATPVVDTGDLWSELSHPSVWIHAPTAPTNKLQEAVPGSPEHTRLTNEVIKANLGEQQRLLDLLEEFYAEHQPVSFGARLIVEIVDLGESMLRPQGASVRLTLDDKALQEQWSKEYAAELGTLTDFLVRKLEDKS